VSDQLIRWCCIDRLSWHDKSGLFFPRQIFDLSLLRKSAAVMLQIMQSDTPNGFPFPSAWTTTGYVVCAVSALVGRIVHEETILTWRNGPQMIGFALA
jgi:hypothetical protein